MKRPFGALATGLLTVGVVSCQTQPEQEARAAPELELSSAGQAFFEAVASQCGSSFPGGAVLVPEADSIFSGAALRLSIDSCTDREIRMALQVDEDLSRSWILTFDGSGLRFTHRKDGVAGDGLSVMGWGGDASPNGGPDFQHFPDSGWLADRTDHHRRPVWRFRVDEERGQLVYYLDRGTEPRYRFVFHTGQDRGLAGVLQEQ